MIIALINFLSGTSFKLLFNLGFDYTVPKVTQKC